MSSQEDEPNDIASQNAKKRRIQRACDVCRRKKIRCDGAQMPDNKCSNCTTYNYECTYNEAAKKRGPPKGYVESLETRLEKMEGLLKKLCPDADFSKELGGRFDREAWLAETRAGADRPSRAGPSCLPSQSSVAAHPPTHPTNPDDLEPSDDEVMAHQTLVNSLQQIKLNPTTMRFFGKSSSIMFVQTAMDLKREYSGKPTPERKEQSMPALLEGARRKAFRSLHPVRPRSRSPSSPSLLLSRSTYQPRSRQGSHAHSACYDPALQWLASQLQELPRPHKQSDFPEESLMFLLIDLYFKEVQPFTPLLHRPTFERNIREGVHLEDVGFGSTVLLVCAIGARHTDDPRVCLHNYPDNRLSSGWEWFKQVQMIRQSMLAPPRLYDLQVYCLTAIFLQGSSAPQASWTLIGVGIRMAQDVGAHRKKVYNAKPTVEEELWKRAFWVLVSMDRSISSVLGRPCAIQDEDFDLDLPIECDDEYWENDDPELAWKQPPGKPSLVTFFNCFLRLNQILAFALRTIYSINKSKALLGFVGQQWEQHIVAELDSALNKWIDSVPDHLRWDPNREDVTFLNQSANLYASYYQLQISVHRPFIPSPRKPSPLSFPSLAICTNAARSCTHVMDVQCRRTGSALPHNQVAMFTCGIVLLLNIWGGKRSGLSTDAQKEMADVHKCMKMLKMLEPRWHTAGRLWDILYELAYVGDLPLPQNTPPNNKRDRDSDSPRANPSPGADGYTPAANTATPGASSLDPTQRTFAGSRRVSRDTASLATTAASFGQQQMQQSVFTPSDVPSPMGVADPANASAATNTFALPIHSDELGRLPLHGFTMSSMVSTPLGPSSQAPSSLAQDWFGADTGGPSTLSTMPGPSSAPPPPPTSQVQSESQPQAGPSRVESPSADMAGGLDASGIASMFGPLEDSQVYDSLFASMPATYAGVQDFPGAMGVVMGQGPGQGVPGSGGQPGPSQGGQGQDTFADNTLAMWSSAPSDFQWDDWGTYISGMNNPMGQTSRPGEP
ncbi:fungal-specific transcription factor domain-containing protein [Rhodofomes roseus]|uniref:Fungal-specific transcription factor domain-containing protein n=1 Tax=Rhodofomes roseus TaxID=34475 RepID=A0ABQ8K214_9APHY|nr:fungal-specific transcription factor domain-containing protein [Rhodofomes roseus]KAH9830265.1 fungal-specific transcription factor domain-containing protein [Rhodofomes roseus]